MTNPCRLDTDIYIASKTKHAHRWRALRDSGVPIVSTWIYEAGPGETESFPDLCKRCIEEASDADFLICYSEAGEALKGALIEVGAALSWGTRVMWVGPLQTFCKHPLVTVCSSLEDALRTIEKILEPR